MTVSLHQLVTSDRSSAGPCFQVQFHERQDWTYLGMDQYLLIPFLGGWTSINPSYFDVNYRGTRFWHTAIWSGHSRDRWEDERPRRAITCYYLFASALAAETRHVWSAYWPPLVGRRLTPGEMGDVVVNDGRSMLWAWYLAGGFNMVLFNYCFSSILTWDDWLRWQIFLGLFLE